METIEALNVEAQGLEDSAQLHKRAIASHRRRLRADRQALADLKERAAFIGLKLVVVTKTKQSGD